MERDLDLIDKKIKDWLKEIKTYIEDNRITYVDTKSNYKDLVTNIDREVENLLISRIKESFPNDLIVAEESFNKELKLSEGPVWFIDPIDGTANFVKQGEDYCSMIGYFEDSSPKLSYIFDIEKDKLYSAKEGLGIFVNELEIPGIEDTSLEEAIISIDIARLLDTEIFKKVTSQAFRIRHVGASGLDGMKVALGRYGGYISSGGGLWDIAPHILFAKEQGLNIYDFEGEKIQYLHTGPFVYSTKAIRKDIITN